MNDHQNETAAVMNLQRYLLQVSHDPNRVTAPPVDGIFDSATADSLRLFQEEAGLPATGRADQETWERLYDAYRASVAANSPPRMIAVFPRLPPDAALAVGCGGFAVTAVQAMLTELCANYSDLGDFGVTGIYDEATKHAVTVFQKRNLLPTDGKVNSQTWNCIADQYNVLFNRYPRQ